MPSSDVFAPDSPRAGGASVRMKLTLSYAGFLVVAGIALFTVGFLLLRFVPEGDLRVAGGSWAPNRADLLEVFVRYAWWALGLLVAVGLVGGWLLAGRMLAPLDRITDAVRRARDGSLDHRIAIAGRRDELTDLADAFDGMLARVQHTLDEERRFAANASHELRTPLTIIRTIVEVAQADPSGRDVDTVLERIGITNDRAIALTEALLALARAGRGAQIEREPVDLAALAAVAVDEVQTDAAAAGIRFESSLAPAVMTGNRMLLEQLATNLVQNAVAHNVPGGRVFVSTMSPSTTAAVLTVANTGAMIDAASAATLTEPFVRGGGRIRGHGDGAGLGLAIVASIVRAHGGTLEVAPGAEGGLQVRVTLPVTASVAS
jgi:two-component system sensor histidine kinase VanS